MRSHQIVNGVIFRNGRKLHQSAVDLQSRRAPSHRTFLFSRAESGLPPDTPVPHLQAAARPPNRPNWEHTSPPDSLAGMGCGIVLLCIHFDYLIQTQKSAGLLSLKPRRLHAHVNFVLIKLAHQLL